MALDRRRTRLNDVIVRFVVGIPPATVVSFGFVHLGCGGKDPFPAIHGWFHRFWDPLSIRPSQRTDCFGCLGMGSKPIQSNPRISPTAATQQRTNRRRNKNINTSPTPRSMAVQSKRQVGGCASAGSIVLLLQR